MKQPKFNNLKIEKKGTLSVRKAIAKSKSIKITINIENESLATIKQIATESGVPYQRLINKLLKEAVDKRSENTNRLDKIENELIKIKQKLKSVV